MTLLANRDFRDAVRNLPLPILPTARTLVTPMLSSDYFFFLLLLFPICFDERQVLGLLVGILQAMPPGAADGTLCQCAVLLGRVDIVVDVISRLLANSEVSSNCSCVSLPHPCGDFSDLL